MMAWIWTPAASLRKLAQRNNGHVFVVRKGHESKLAFKVGMLARMSYNAFHRNNA